MIPNISTVLKGIFVGSLGMMLGGLISLQFYKNSLYDSSQTSKTNAEPTKEDAGCKESARVISGSIDKYGGVSQASCNKDMFIENVELENGNILIICRCSDPSGCIEQDLSITQQPSIREGKTSL